MSIIIRVGVCTEDPRKLDKRPNFESSSPAEISVDVKDNCSIMSPQFILTAALVDLTQYNFLHVPSWGRYYYINDIVALTGSRVSIRCAEDVLTSNADQILGLSAYVVRSEQHKNAYLPNSSYHAQTNRQCETIPFNRTPFTANYGSDQVYLLSIMGGSQQPTQGG